MGMFDHVYIEPNVIEQHDIKCICCGKLALGLEWQTKDVDYPSMDSYYLARDKEWNLRLYKLDEPSDKRFWHEYTDEEIEKNNKENEGRKLFKDLFNRKKGDGYWKEEAFLPKHRRQRSMGELPHQYVRVYTHCRCCDENYRTDEGFIAIPGGTDYWKKHSIDLNIKFTDGVAVSIERKEEE